MRTWKNGGLKEEAADSVNIFVFGLSRFVESLGKIGPTDTPGCSIDSSKEEKQQQRSKVEKPKEDITNVLNEGRYSFR